MRRNGSPWSNYTLISSHNMITMPFKGIRFPLHSSIQTALILSILGFSVRSIITFRMFRFKFGKKLSLHSVDRPISTEITITGSVISCAGAGQHDFAWFLTMSKRRDLSLSEKLTCWRSTMIYRRWDSERQRGSPEGVDDEEEGDSTLPLLPTLKRWRL